jgi:hypothetical protein
MCAMSYSKGMSDHDPERGEEGAQHQPLLDLTDEAAALEQEDETGESEDKDEVEEDMTPLGAAVYNNHIDVSVLTLTLTLILFLGLILALEL